MSLLRGHLTANSVVGLDASDAPGPGGVAVVGGTFPQAVDAEPSPVPLGGGACTDPIEELLLAVASGDREAYAALKCRVVGLVRLNIRRVLGDASHSAAVTRQFFAELPGAVADFDPQRDSAQTWLLTRAHLRAMSGLTSGQAAND